MQIVMGRLVELAGVGREPGVDGGRQTSEESRCVERVRKEEHG